MTQNGGKEDLSIGRSKKEVRGCESVRLQVKRQDGIKSNQEKKVGQESAARASSD